MRGPGLKDVKPSCQPLAQASEISPRTSLHMDSDCTRTCPGFWKPDLRGFDAQWRDHRRWTQGVGRQRGVLRRVRKYWRRKFLCDAAAGRVRGSLPFAANGHEAQRSVKLGLLSLSVLHKPSGSPPPALPCISRTSFGALISFYEPMMTCATGPRVLAFELLHAAHNRRTVA
jgi:hypothetical protein